MIESMGFQKEKERPKSVNFNDTDCIIPNTPSPTQLSSSDHIENSAEPDKIVATDTPPFEHSSPSSPASVSSEGSEVSIKGILRNNPGGSKYQPPSTNPTNENNTKRTETVQWKEDVKENPAAIGVRIQEPSEDDDRISRLVELDREITPTTSPESQEDSYLVHPPSTNGRVSPIMKPRLNLTPSTTARQESSQSTQQQAKAESPSPPPLFNFIRPTREPSRLLAEKMPSEMLRRMIIRWPVGDEEFQDRSELNSNRLMMNVWDASGDPLQLNFIPFFYSERSIFITAYDITHGLDEVCESYRTKDLRNIDGSFPTNAEVLESWIGCATAHTKETPALPFKCTSKTPVLPPIIITCTKIDIGKGQESATNFVKFFDRKSFDTYKKHLVEYSNPTAVGVSNHSETIFNSSEELDEEFHYSGHHILRREVDYLARQMPYICDEVPIQWVKFEQLLCGLQQQKKMILLYDDLSKYISEHCSMSGPLRILPVLSQFHDMGTIAFFYRHPELNKLVIIRPQWLASSLGSIITSHPGNWVTPEVQNAFTKLGKKGVISKDMLSLAYRCARMGQRHWNEMLFILNCMDIICCHPSLHEKNSYYLPAMVVVGALDPFYIPMDSDPIPLYFTAGESALPIAVFNQLVVRCVRSCQYEPTFYYQMAHIRLNSTHHLLLWKEHTAIACLVQSNVTHFCPTCQSKETQFEFSPSCSSIAHLIRDQTDLMPSDNISRLIESSTNSGVDPKLHLSLSDDCITLESVCPQVLHFIGANLQFLCDCWLPGLRLHIAEHTSATPIVLNQHWRHTVLNVGDAPKKLQVWFE